MTRSFVCLFLGLEALQDDSRASRTAMEVGVAPMVAMPSTASTADEPAEPDAGPIVGRKYLTLGLYEPLKPGEFEIKSKSAEPGGFGTPTLGEAEAETIEMKVHALVPAGNYSLVGAGDAGSFISRARADMHNVGHTEEADDSDAEASGADTATGADAPPVSMGEKLMHVLNMMATVDTALAPLEARLGAGMEDLSAEDRSEGLRMLGHIEGLRSHAAHLFSVLNGEAMSPIQMMPVLRHAQVAVAGHLHALRDAGHLGNVGSSSPATTTAFLERLDRMKDEPISSSADKIGAKIEKPEREELSKKQMMEVDAAGRIREAVAPH